MDVQQVPQIEDASVPGVREEVAPAVTLSNQPLEPTSKVSNEEVRRYGRYRGDLDNKGDFEPDLHFMCRWVIERAYHPREPENLKGFREMLEKSPERFYSIYQKEKDRYEAILDHWDEVDAKKEAEAKALAKEETAPADVGTEKCLELLGKLIGELTGKKPAPPRK